jgi:hypothetical protein
VSMHVPEIHRTTQKWVVASSLHFAPLHGVPDFAGAAIIAGNVVNSAGRDASRWARCSACATASFATGCTACHAADFTSAVSSTNMATTCATFTFTATASSAAAASEDPRKRFGRDVPECAVCEWPSGEQSERCRRGGSRL